MEMMSSEPGRDLNTGCSCRTLLVLHKDHGRGSTQKREEPQRALLTIFVFGFVSTISIGNQHASKVCEYNWLLLVNNL